MKVRESGMPDEKLWNSFFNPVKILQKLSLDKYISNVVEFGSGYGTFTLPAASIINGNLYAIEIEDEMITVLQKKIKRNLIKNIEIVQRDFLSEGTGLKNNSVDYAMLFNILHHEEPIELLKEAHRILTPNGTVSVIHWKYDESTPRGPSLDIRPKPEECRNWLKQAGFKIESADIDLPPYHYGILGKK